MTTNRKASKPGERLRINRQTLSELKEAIRKLKALCTVGDQSRCAVDDAHKEGVRLYVQSWVTPLVESAVDRIEGRKDSRGRP